MENKTKKSGLSESKFILAYEIYVITQLCSLDPDARFSRWDVKVSTAHRRIHIT